jgi:SpoVK/Ycf46/Vps4 family AAA+-type ATPase
MSQFKVGSRVVVERAGSPYHGRRGYVESVQGGSAVLNLGLPRGVRPILPTAALVGIEESAEIQNLPAEVTATAEFQQWAQSVDTQYQARGKVIIRGEDNKAAAYVQPAGGEVSPTPVSTYSYPTAAAVAAEAKTGDTFEVRDARDLIELVHGYSTVTAHAQNGRASATMRKKDGGYEVVLRNPGRAFSSRTQQFKHAMDAAASVLAHLGKVYYAKVTETSFELDNNKYGKAGSNRGKIVLVNDKAPVAGAVKVGDHVRMKMDDGATVEGFIHSVDGKTCKVRAGARTVTATAEAKGDGLEIGDEVLAQKTPEGSAVRAVVIDKDAKTGAVCITRLTKDGVIRQEKIWTGRWHSVAPAGAKTESETKGGAPARLLREYDEDSYEAREQAHPNARGRARTLVQYADGGNVLSSSQRTRPNLEAGVYAIKSSMQGIYFEKIEQNSDGILEFDDERLNEVRSEIDNFWTLGEAFREMGITHKRGVLLYGLPGMGKSILLRQVSESAIRDDNVVFIGGRNMGEVVQGLREFKEVEPDRRCLVVMEDMDEVCNYNEHAVLELMDGGDQMNGVLIVGTTNYPERLPPRILRSGRFDSKVEIKTLPPQGRRAYFTHKLSKVESPERIEEIVALTDGFSFAQMRELIAAAYCYRRPVEATVDRIRRNFTESAGTKNLTEARLDALLRRAGDTRFVTHAELRGEAVVVQGVPDDVAGTRAFKKWTDRLEKQHSGSGKVFVSDAGDRAIAFVQRDSNGEVDSASVDEYEYPAEPEPEGNPDHLPFKLGREEADDAATQVARDALKPHLTGRLDWTDEADDGSVYLGAVAEGEHDAAVAALEGAGFKVVGRSGGPFYGANGRDYSKYTRLVNADKSVAVYIAQKLNTFGDLSNYSDKAEADAHHVEIVPQ